MILVRQFVLDKELQITAAAAEMFSLNEAPTKSWIHGFTWGGDRQQYRPGTMTPLPGSQFTHFAYNPNVAANACYIATLSFCLLVQLIQGVRYRTWDFMGPMLAGISLELMGYTARIFMHNDPSSREAFLMLVPC